MFLPRSASHILRRFARDESGVVTVDYIVLSAATVGLCLAGVGIVQDAVFNLSVALSEGVSVPVEPEE
ncbi:MAG: hypothetical protein AAF689_18605 [Pseudomonadota bacterium]